MTTTTKNGRAEEGVRPVFQRGDRVSLFASCEIRAPAPGAHYVYLLCDPRLSHHSARYVGITNHPVRRFQQHLLRPARRVKDWINDLASTGFAPEMLIVETIPPHSSYSRPDIGLEHRWVTRLKGDGHDLLNISPRPRVLRPFPQLPY